MKVENISSQHFKGLNISKLAPYDRELISSDINVLKKLGENYDISLKSSSKIIGVPVPSIKITVQPLQKGLSFFQRLRSPKVSTHYCSEVPKKLGLSGDSVVSSTKNLIEELKTKLLNKKSNR